MNVYALCTVEAGARTLECLATRIPLAGVIGLTDRAPGDAISGYVHMAPIARRLGLPFVGLKSYAITDAEDRRQLERLKIDLLIVCGWQRLVPPWLIACCHTGVIGVHGSADGICAGRGRSPQNWALILGAQSFSISIFFIDAGIDSGDVIASRSFRYSDTDDINSSYAKVALLTSEMIIEAFESGRILQRRGERQKQSASYFPQRLPEDGALDWRRPSIEICRFIGALTRPYPGAFSSIDSRNIKIWRARPLDFGSHVLPGASRTPGQIVLTSPGGPFAVAAEDGLVLVDDYEADASGADALRVGARFTSVHYQTQLREIILRHQRRHPELPLNARLLEAAG